MWKSLSNRAKQWTIMVVAVTATLTAITAWRSAGLIWFASDRSVQDVSSRVNGVSFDVLQFISNYHEDQYNEMVREIELHGANVHNTALRDTYKQRWDAAEKKLNRAQPEGD